MPGEITDARLIVPVGPGTSTLDDGELAFSNVTLTLYVGWNGTNRPVGGSGTGANKLLDGTNHTDTVDATCARGTLIVGSSAATPKWTTLALGASGRVLRSDGTDAGWSQVVLTTDVTGTLPIANGGTGAATQAGGFDALAPTTTRGDIIYRNATTNARLAAGASARIMQSDGTDPGWVAVSGDATIAAGGAITLANSGASAATYGSATQSAVVAVDAKGRITSASNATITPAVGSITGLGTGVATFLATPSSANLAAAVTGETGSGALVFGTTPDLAAPNISGGSIDNAAITGSTISDTPINNSAIGGSIPAAGTFTTLIGTTVQGGTVRVLEEGGSGGAHYVALTVSETLSSSRSLTITVNDANRTISLAGNITTAAAFITSGANSLTLTTTGTTNVTLPTTGTLATLAGSETLTGKILQTINAGLRLTDTGSNHYLAVTVNEDLSANRVLNLVVNNADRTIDLSGDLTVASGGATVSGTNSGGANPTASAGLSAVNGSATTFMRSDGAPAISQSITPTWTGAHIFAGTVINRFEDGVTGATTTVQITGHNSTGTPTDGFGLVDEYQLESSTAASTTAANTTVTWATAAHGTRKARVVHNVYDTSAREALRLEASGAAAMIGFLGASASAQLASPDAGTALVTFGLASGTPTFAVANLTGTTLPASVVASSLTSVGTLTSLSVGNITTTGTITFDQSTDVVLTASSANLESSVTWGSNVRSYCTGTSPRFHLIDSDGTSNEGMCINHNANVTTLASAADSNGGIQSIIHQWNLGTGAQTWGSGSAATLAVTVNLSGTDPVMTFGSASLTIGAASFTCGALSATTGTHSGTCYIGDTANGTVTLGLTINQGAADDVILSLKSSDVATGLTTIVSGTVETDDYAAFSKWAAATGGLLFQALGENAAVTSNFVLESYGGQASTTHTNAGRALFEVYVSQHDGANALSAVTADGNVFAVRCNQGGSDKTVFLVDEDGDLFADGSDVSVVDEHDDVALVRAFDVARSDAGAKGLVRNHWDKYVAENESKLVDLGVLGAPRGEGGLINMTRLAMLHNGALWQMYSDLMDVVAALPVEVKRALPDRIRRKLEG